MGGAFGGLGGMGGGRSRSGGMGGMYDDDDEPMSGFGGMPSGMGGMPGGMGGMPGGGPRRSSSFRGAPRSSSPAPGSAAPSEITRPLKTSLEDLYHGATKHLKVGRRLLDGSTEDKVLEIQVLPGWKSGTKVRFPRAGNEVAPGEAQDLVFVVEEKPHERFVREGNNLVTKVPIHLVDALAGADGKRTVEALDGRKIQVPVPSGIIKPGQTTTVPGEGMPVRKEGSVRKKGDLIVQWNIIFPDRLSTSQKEGIRKVLG